MKFKAGQRLRSGAEEIATITSVNNGKIRVTWMSLKTERETGDCEYTIEKLNYWIGKGHMSLAIYPNEIWKELNA